MEITVALRNLLIETAESMTGAERRRFMANTLDKLQLGQREAAGLFGWARDTLRKALHERRSGLTCAGRLLLPRSQARRVPLAPSASTTFAASSRTTSRPTPPSRPPGCIAACPPPRSAGSSSNARATPTSSCPACKPSPPSSTPWASACARWPSAAPKKSEGNRRHLSPTSRQVHQQAAASEDNPAAVAGRQGPSPDRPVLAWRQEPHAAPRGPTTTSSRGES